MMQRNACQEAEGRKNRGDEEGDGLVEHSGEKEDKSHTGNTDALLLIQCVKDARLLHATNDEPRGAASSNQGLVNKAARWGIVKARVPEGDCRVRLCSSEGWYRLGRVESVGCIVVS
eukprot:1151147-Pelagomonas_calceolata.AAC.2